MFIWNKQTNQMLLTDVIGELSGGQRRLYLLWLCWRRHQSVRSIQPAVHHHTAPTTPAGSRPHPERSARVQIQQTYQGDAEKHRVNALITDCVSVSTAVCYLSVQVLSIPTRWLWPLTPAPNTWPVCTTTTACMCGTLRMWGTRGSCTLLCTTAAPCGASK